MYTWTAFCVLAMSVGQLLGGTLFSGLLALVFDTRIAVGLCYGLLPAYAYIKCRKDATLSPEDRRMMLLALSLGIGVFSGHLLSECYFGLMTPPQFILPAVIGFSAAIIGPKFTNDRKLFLGLLFFIFFVCNLI